MSLKVRLSDLIKASMKSGDKETLTYARNLHAAIRKKEIDDRVELDDLGIQKIAQSSAKQRQESIDQFTQGGRMDLVDSEKKELAFLQTYLPTQMADSELVQLVTDSIGEAAAVDIKDLGKVMKVLSPKIQGRADGKRVQEAVRKALGA